MRKSGLASLAFYYCDFRDEGKRDLRGLLSSLRFQLCDQSDFYCDTLSGLYRNGSQSPDETSLTECLRDMSSSPEEAPVFLVVDALDVCPNASGKHREEDLTFLENLVDIRHGFRIFAFAYV
jgi:hypothetical protein